MKTTRLALAVAILSTVAVSGAHANKPPPQNLRIPQVSPEPPYPPPLRQAEPEPIPRQPQDCPLTLEFHSPFRPTLHLSRKTLLDLPALRADASGDDRRHAGFHVVITGVALSLALVSAGLWAVKSGHRRRMAGLAGLLLIGAAVGVSCAHFPGGSTPTPDEQTSLKVIQKGTVTGTVFLDLDEADGVRLELPPESLDGLVDRAAVGH